MNVFVSYASDDLLIAKNFCRNINNAFKGHVNAEYAEDFLKPGSEWKRTIREKLGECDAIVIILTSESQKRPWIYIEWSAFWMAEKQIFIATDDKVDWEKIINPMKDTQIFRMSDIDQIKAFIAEISRLAGIDTVPYKDAETFVNGFKAAQNEISAQSMDAYLNPSKQLPRSDAEKFEIVEYFIESKNYKHVHRICSDIRDDSYTFRACVDLIDQDVLDIVFDVASLINRPRKLADLAEILVERRQYESPLFDNLLERISHIDQTILTALFRVSFRNEASREIIFNKFYTYFDNLPEIRKVAIHLSEINEDQDARMNQVAEKFRGTNYAELRKLIEKLHENGRERFPYFQNMLSILRSEAPRQFDLLQKAGLNFQN